MRKGMVLGVLALAGCCVCDKNDKSAVSAVSPDGRNEIRLSSDPLAYSVYRDGVLLVAPTEIGMKIDGAALKAAGCPKVTTTVLSGSEATPTWKKAKLDLAGNGTSADFGDWGVDLIARNDGVAYRFQTKKQGRITVDCERAGLTFTSPDLPCWAYLTGLRGAEESIATNCTVGALRTAAEGPANWLGKTNVYLPFVFTSKGKYVLVTDADARDYPVLNFTHGAGASATAFAGSFERWPKKTVRKGSWEQDAPPLATGGRKIVITENEDYLVKTEGTRTYPWRVFMLADAPSRFCEAEIVRALAAPAAKDADFSWVKPGKVAWDWWNCFDHAQIPANGGCNTKTYEKFIDFAAKTGVEYVIFDEGWSETLNIWKFHKDVDVPHLIDYANKKGVGIILWMAWAQVYGDEAKVASHFAKLGAKGFKVDFMDRADAEMSQFLRKFAAECAKNRMLVDYHGVERPWGLEREFPNVINYEGIHGLEQMKWHDDSYDFMQCDVRGFFLRMSAGRMDYTPGAMLNYAKGTYKGHDVSYPGSYGTRCRQMAMMAMFEAPLQMLCDSPTNYEKNMESFRFMAATPVVWDDVIGLDGDLDAFAAVARKAKDGSWYAAGMTDWNARDYAFSTKFLGAGEWKAEIFRDAPDSDVKATNYVHETKTVKAGDDFKVRMAPGGGFVVRFSK